MLISLLVIQLLFTVTSGMLAYIAEVKDSLKVRAKRKLRGTALYLIGTNSLLSVLTIIVNYNAEIKAEVAHRLEQQKIEENFKTQDRVTNPLFPLFISFSVDLPFDSFHHSNLVEYLDKIRASRANREGNIPDIISLENFGDSLSHIKNFNILFHSSFKFVFSETSSYTKDTIQKKLTVTISPAGKYKSLKLGLKVDWLQKTVNLAMRYEGYQYDFEDQIESNTMFSSNEIIGKFLIIAPVYYCRFFPRTMVITSEQGFQKTIIIYLSKWRLKGEDVWYFPGKTIFTGLYSHKISEKDYYYHPQFERRDY